MILIVAVGARVKEDQVLSKASMKMTDRKIALSIQNGRCLAMDGLKPEATDLP